MKKSLASILSIVSILTFGIIFFGCSNSTNTNTDSTPKPTTEEIINKNKEDFSRVYSAMKTYGTYEKVVDSVHSETLSRVYIYTSLKENILSTFNKTEINGYFNDMYEISFPNEKKYIEVTPKINNADLSVKYYKVRLYDASQASKKGDYYARCLELTVNEIENFGKEPTFENSLDPAAFKKFDSIGTKVATLLPEEDNSNAAMFQYSSLNNNFLTKFNDINLNAMNSKGYNGFNFDSTKTKDYYWIEFYIEGTKEKPTYNIRFIPKGVTANSNGWFAKEKTFISKDEFNNFFN